MQHAQNDAARLVIGAWKYARALSRLMHDDLRWLVIPQRVLYKLAVTRGNVEIARLDIAGLDNGGLDIDGLDNGGLDIDELDIDGLDNDGRMCM